MSDVERNVEVIRRLEGAYNAQDHQTVRSLLAPGFTAHTPGADMLPAGAEGSIQANAFSFAAMPDRRTEILDLFGEGDRTVSHVRLRGTNSGGPIVWAGLTGPTGKTVDFDWVQMGRHDEQGRLAETWAQMDTPRMLMQLGVMPAAGTEAVGPPGATTRGDAAVHRSRGGGMRSPDEAKAIARRFYDEVFNKNNLKHAEEEIAESIVEHNPLTPDMGHDRAAALASLQAILDNAPDLTVEIHDMVATGDRVATRATFRGTDTGKGWGAPMGAAATGRSFAVEGIDVGVLDQDGRIVEHYGLFDVPGMLTQLGLMSPPGGGS